MQAHIVLTLLAGTLANSEEPDEMPHTAVFIRVCTVCLDENYLLWQKCIFDRKFNKHTLKIQNGQFYDCCYNLNMYVVGEPEIQKLEKVAGK